MGAPPWTQADTDRLIQLHGEGHSLGHIAGVMGRSKSTLSGKAKAAGLTWDRASTATATKAKTRDAAARRADLQLLLLDDVEKLRKQMFAPTTVFNFGGKDNTYEERQVDEPTFADKLKIMQAVGIGIDRHVKLAQHDAGQGATAVIGLLQQTAAALGITDAPETPGQGEP